MPHTLAFCLQQKDGWPKVTDIYFEDNETTATPWDEVISVEKTGMYYLWFVICDPDLSGATVEGSTVWKNPTGRVGSVSLSAQASFRCASWSAQHVMHGAPAQTVATISPSVSL